MFKLRGGKSRYGPWHWPPGPCFCEPQGEQNRDSGSCSFPPRRAPFPAGSGSELLIHPEREPLSWLESTSAARPDSTSSPAHAGTINGVLDQPGPEGPDVQPPLPRLSEKESAPLKPFLSHKRQLAKKKFTFCKSKHPLQMSFCWLKRILKWVFRQSKVMEHEHQGQGGPTHGSKRCALCLEKTGEASQCSRGCGRGKPGLLGQNKGGGMNRVDDKDGCWLARPACCCESSVCWQRKWRAVGQEDADGGPGGESGGHTGVWPLKAPGSCVEWWDLRRRMGLGGSWMRRGGLESPRILSKRVSFYGDHAGSPEEEPWGP